MAEIDSHSASESGSGSWSDMGIGFAIYMMKGIVKRKTKRPEVLDYWHGDLSHMPAMIQQDLWPTSKGKGHWQRFKCKDLVLGL